MRSNIAKTKTSAGYSLKSNLKRLEQFLFYLLLFSTPFQTRKILWQQNWYFNEWQAISIYGTDILLAILIGFWFFRGAKPKVAHYDYFLFAFVAISALSIKNSSNIYISAWSVLKLVEFVVFYFYIKSYAINAFGFIPSLLALISGALFQSVVAIWQFFRQSDLGLRILGESLLGKDMTGIASFFNLHGEKVIRAYGTTPHPNVLAAYLFLAIFAFYFLWIYKNISKLYLLVYGLALLAFFFTFARVMILLFFLNFLTRALLVRLKFKGKYWNRKLALLFLATLIVVVAFSVFYWPEAVSRIKISSGEEAVQLRIFYNKESLSSLNWFGVGSGNFVNWLMAKDPNIPRYLYQPVHNIYLLAYSETGILGVSAFLLFLFFLAKDFIYRTHMAKLYHYSFFLIFLSTLFMGFFDHFLLTLQQGRLMFWLIAALLTIDENDDIIKTKDSSSGG